MLNFVGEQGERGRRGGEGESRGAHHLQGKPTPHPSQEGKGCRGAFIRQILIDSRVGKNLPTLPVESVQQGASHICQKTLLPPLLGGVRGGFLVPPSSSKAAKQLALPQNTENNPDRVWPMLKNSTNRDNLNLQSRYRVTQQPH